jgi:16S rRNA (cytosine1402-N4)-methyltransferase
MEEELHKPVLLSEVLHVLSPKEGESYLDLTAGYGGHASKVLEMTQNYKDAVLNDRDESAISYLRVKFSEKPVEYALGDFYNTALSLVESGKTFDLILADFGVSSPQLDEPERGFAFAHEGPLDMRMDRRQELTAGRIVNKWSEAELVRIFTEYGEESVSRAQKVAREISRRRPISTTAELEKVASAGMPWGKRNPATKIFQALRIAVNDELGQIERTLALMPKLLSADGRVAIISFHSLEDRLVKNWLREVTSEGEESQLTLITKKPVIAENAELVINPRARSAKLRAARRRGH